MKLIELTKGRFAKVDDDDFDYLNQFSWHAHDTPDNKICYARRNSKYIKGQKRSTIFMHREIFLMHSKNQYGKVTDHVDHDGLNNQKENLRSCSQRENCMNNRSRDGKTSNYLGVYFHNASQKWVATIQINRKSKHIGVFDDEKIAAEAYDKKASEHFGEFANLNFK